MPSDFIIAVIHKETGEIAHQWEPGGRVEHDIEQHLLDRVLAKGVGFGRTKKHVVEDVKAAWRELLHDLKSQVRP